MIRAALLIALAATPAAAQLYRCDSPAGVEYRDRPCISGTQSAVDITNARHGLPVVLAAPIEPPRAQRAPVYQRSPAEAPPPAIVLVPVERTLVIEHANTWPGFYWWPGQEVRRRHHGKPAPPSYIDPAALRRK
jgi:hypothetical protein